MERARIQWKVKGPLRMTKFNILEKSEHLEPVSLARINRQPEADLGSLKELMTVGEPVFALIPAPRGVF